MGVVVTTHGFVASVGWRGFERGGWAGDKAAELSVGGGIVPINQLLEAICVH